MILVLEDDFKLVDDFDTKLIRCLGELPDNWQGLWLGGRVLKRKEPYSENLYSISGTTGTFGYIVRREFVLALVEQLRRFDKVADHSMSRAFKNVFRSKRNLVLHRNGYSYIKNREVNYYDLSHE